MRENTQLHEVLNESTYISLIIDAKYVPLFLQVYFLGFTGSCVLLLHFSKLLGARRFTSLSHYTFY